MWAAAGVAALLATDQALQKRVWQVGMSVVPAFQKQMARDQAVRIHFRFVCCRRSEDALAERHAFQIFCLPISRQCHR